MINDLKYIDGVLYQLTPLSKQWTPVPGQGKRACGARITEDGEKYVYYGGPLPHHGGKSRVQELLIREVQIAALKEQLASANSRITKLQAERDYAMARGDLAFNAGLQDAKRDEQRASAEADARIKGANLEQARKELQAQAKMLCDKVDCWKRIAANRKERNNALAEMMRRQRDVITNQDGAATSIRAALARHGYKNINEACSAADSARAELSRERETVRLLRTALEKMIGLANCFIPAGRTNSIVEFATKVLQGKK